LSAWQPVAPDRLTERLANWLAGTPGIVRLAVDGAPATAPGELADRLTAPLRALGRPAVHVRAAGFWRDASLRFEHGREDALGYPDWLDAEALRREVLDPAVTASRYLPSLRDPVTNRSTREAPRPIPARAVLMVSGAFLLTGELPFDRTIHLAMSAAARERRTPAAERWTLPAFEPYAARAARADVVVKLDDPRHPAVRGLP
jgi:hypothetical protein